MKPIFIFLMSFFSYCSFGQVNQYTKPSEYNTYVPPLDLKLLNNNLREQQNRIDTNKETISDALDDCYYVVEARRKEPCYTKLRKYYQSLLDNLNKQKLDLTSAYVVKSILKNIREVKIFIVNVECEDI